MTNQWSRSSRCDSSQCVEVQWRKSQLSSNNGSCVEVAFHKAHASSGTGNCVEVRTCDCDEILVRDSKDPDGPFLNYTRDEWLAFLDGAKKGEFDL
jgi:hypothetical protein